MKRIIMSQEEKNRILESHNSFREDLMGHLFDKNLIKEDITALLKNQTRFSNDDPVIYHNNIMCKLLVLYMIKIGSIRT